jgi:WD40 repeat protein
MSPEDPVPRADQIAIARDQATQFVLGRGVQNIYVGSGRARAQGPVAAPAYWATVAEIRHRTGMLAGRQDELARVWLFAMGTEDYRWLSGDAWAGKTSLLAEAVTTSPGNVDVVCYFLSRREADADSSRFLAAVVPQLAFLLGEDPPAAGLHEFRALWQRAAGMAGTADRHLLLVVDGLDEDMQPPGLPSVAAVLPAVPAGSGHVLVSSRTNWKLPGDVPVGHPLRRLEPVLVEPFAGSRELAALARQEIDDLLRRDSSDGLATDVLGLMGAAGGPLAVHDLAALTTEGPPSAALARQIRVLLTTSAARSAQPAGAPADDRYQFAHESLLAYVRADLDLGDPQFRRRIDRWADQWRAAGWLTPDRGETGVPRYLLDSYPATLTREPLRLAQLAGDAGWAEAAIAAVGVDTVLANLRQAVAAAPASAAVAAVMAAVNGQARLLRPPFPVDQPGYILRQLWMQSAGLADDDLARDIRDRLRRRSGPVPEWTTRRVSGALSVELGLHDGVVYAVAVLADGRVVTGGSDRRVRVWDPADPASSPVELARTGSSVYAVAVLADGRVVTGGQDGAVRVWDPADPAGSPVELGRHDSEVWAVAVLPDGRVVTGGQNRRVRVWDPADPGASPVELGSHGGWVRAVMVLADGRVVTAGDDQLLVWQPAAPGVGPAKLGHLPYWSRVLTVALLPDGRVVTGLVDRQVLVWDPDHPGADPVKLGSHDGAVRAATVLPDGRVVTGGDDGLVLMWDPDHPGTAPAGLGLHEGPVYAVAVLPDGRVVAGGADRRVLVWDPDYPAGVAANPGRHASAALALVVEVAVLPDGRIVTSGDKGRVLVWDADHPEAGPVELGHHVTVRAIGTLSDGRVITGETEGQVLVWNPDRPGASPVELGRHSNQVRAVAVLPDGRVVTSGDDGLVLMWSPANPGCGLAELGRHDSPVRAVAVLPDGRIVTGGNDGRVLVQDPDHPESSPVELGRHDSQVWAVAVLPDGRVVVGGLDGRVLMWNPANLGGGPAELSGHDGPVRAVAVLPDGRVVTGGNDRRVLIQDPAREGNQDVQLTCSMTSLATSPPGQAKSSLVIVHEGGSLSLWSLIT